VPFQVRVETKADESNDLPNASPHYNLPMDYIPAPGEWSLKGEVAAIKAKHLKKTL